MGATIQRGLFAGIITAMILPFSTMDFAEAASNENAIDKEKNKGKKHAKNIEKIQKIRKDHKDALKKAKGETKKKIQKNIDRFELSEKILTELDVINSEARTLSDAKSSNEKIRQYAKELDATYDSELTSTAQSLGTHSFGTISLMSHGSSVDVNMNRVYTQSADDCAKNQNVSGTATTNFKSWTSGAATISTSFSYPSTYSEKAFPWSDCVTFNHDRTTEKNWVLTSWIPGADPGSGQACHTETHSSNGSDSTTCSNFGPTKIVVILENEYGNNTGV